MLPPLRGGSGHSTMTEMYGFAQICELNQLICRDVNRTPSNGMVIVEREKRESVKTKPWARNLNRTRWH